MNDKYSTKIMLASITVLIGAVSFVAACSSPSATKPPASPTTVPQSTPVSSPTPARDATALRAKGQELYQKTAGGVGCQSCHGADARGTNLGPAIRGKSADDIKRALSGDAMSFIRLPNDDIEAVAAYVKYLESQP